MKKILLLFTLFCTLLVNGCGETRLENLVNHYNYQCPLYLESGWYLAQFYMDYNEYAVIFDIRHDTDLGQSIVGGILGLTGAIGLNTWIADELLDGLRDMDWYSTFLQLCRNEGVDIIISVCGEQLRIESWKL